MSFPTPPARLLTELDHVRISNLLRRPGLPLAPELESVIEEVIQGRGASAFYVWP